MNNPNYGVGGGGPLIRLQAAAVPQWQGASVYKDSLMAGGDVETDHDLICCDGQPLKGVFVLTRYDREMLVLYMGAFGGRLLPPRLLSLSPNTIILTQGYADNDLPDILPRIEKRPQRGNPERSLLLNIQDKLLRFHAGADSLQVVTEDCEPSYDHGYIDISVTPGLRRCDVYEFESNTFKDGVVIINTLKDV